MNLEAPGVDMGALTRHSVGTIIRIRPSRPEDGERAVAIWRSAVDASHHFLTSEDRQAIDLQVQDFLPKTPMFHPLVAIHNTGHSHVQVARQSE